MTLEEALAASEAEPVNDIFTVNTESRTITVPDTEKIFGVFNDGNTERKHFRCPKVVGDSIDLTTLHLYINYQNANGKKYPYLVEDVQADGDYITFSWLISPDVVAYKGTVKFVLCAKKGTELEWNTTLAEGTVLEGLEATDEVVERHPDIIEQILTRLDNVTEIPQDKVQSAVDQYMTANPINVPKRLSDLQDDATHRTVTDAEKQTWSGKSDFSGSYNDLTDKPMTLPNPQALTITYGGNSQTYDGSEALAITIETGGGIERVEKLATDTTVTLEPDKLYIFPEMSSLTYTIGEGTGEIHFIFKSGATATRVVHPAGVNIGSFTVDANKIYEVSILEGLLTSQSWAVS
ncbi:hypothetical protein ACQRAE_11600 [Mediterraneibacter faecis]